MTKTAKIVVLSTGDLAIPALETVAETHDVLQIVSRPRRGDEDLVLPEERLSRSLPKWAKAHDIPLRREDSPGGDRFREQLEKLAPDLGLVVSYGRRFPTSLLDVPKRGWLKVHFSLLPKNRGLHPIRSALWYGESKTGATVIQITNEPDAGPILDQESLDIGEGESFGELAPRVAELASSVVLPAIARTLRSKNPKTRAQNEKAATESPRFDRRHLRAPWWRKADVVTQHLRALSPEPGMFALVKRERVRIVQGGPAAFLGASTGDSGSYIGLRSGQILVTCGQSTVFGIRRVQLANGETVSASSFAREQKLRVGDELI